MDRSHKKDSQVALRNPPGAVSFPFWPWGQSAENTNTAESLINKSLYLLDRSEKRLKTKDSNQGGAKLPRRSTKARIKDALRV